MTNEQAQADGEYITQSAGDEIRQKNYDLISRQAMLDYLKANIDDFPDYHEAIEKVLQMPSVNPQEPKYCDRNICLRNEYNGIGCDECEVTKSQESKTDERKEALRELKQEYRHHQYNNSDSCYGWSTSFKQAVAVAIKCLSSELKWIPVSERYPLAEEQYKDFLVIDDVGRMSVQEFYLTLYDHQPFFSGCLNVVAWMPLPPCYDPQERSE